MGSRRLRVFVRAPREARRLELERLLTGAGYDLARGPADAHVVLADGDCPPIEGAVVLTLGAAEGDHAGALESEATGEQINAAIRAVAAGLIVRHAPASERAFAAMEENSFRALLTPRELEILGAMGKGQTNKMIARHLDISLHTVKFHVESIFRKLGVRTRAEAVVRALERRREIIEL